MSSLASQRSLEKAVDPEADSLRDKAGETEEVSIHDTSSSDDGNVGLHEFEIARQSGLQVTPEQSRR